MLSVKTSVKDILILSIPASLAVMIEPLAAMVDTSFMGRIGTDELAAIGIAVNVLMSISWMFNLLLYQVTAEVAKSESIGNALAVKKSLKVAVISSFFISIIICSVLLYSTGFILLDIMQVNSKVFLLAKNYIYIRAPFFLFFLIGSIFLGALRGRLGHKKVLFIAVFETLINILITWYLVVLCDYSVVGAAVGTVVAKLISLALSSLILFRDLEFGFFDMLSYKIGIRDLMRFGIKSSYMFVRSFSLQLLFILAVTYASRQGSLSLASYQVCLELWLLFSFVVEGISIVCTAEGGQLYNSREKIGWNDFSFAALKASFLLGVLFLFLFIIFSREFISIFTNQKDVILLCLSVFYFIALLQPLNSIVFALDGLMFGTEEFSTLAKGCLSGLFVSSGLIFLNSFFKLLDPMLSLWIAMGLMNLFRMLFSLNSYFRIRKSLV